METLGVKAVAWTSDPVTEHISCFRTFVNGQCLDDVHLSSTSCSGTVCGQTCPTSPRRQFPDRTANVTCCLLLWPWPLTDRHVTEVFGVWKIKFRKVLYKCKEGVHINGMPCNAAFSDPGSHCLLSHKRKESTLWVEKSGNWGWIDNRIRDYQVWALKGERSKLSPPNGGATTLKPFPVQLRCVAWPLSHDRPRTSQLPGGWMFTQDIPARYQPPQGPITDPAYYSGTIS